MLNKDYLYLSGDEMKKQIITAPYNNRDDAVRITQNSGAADMNN
jgi:hypothetical protein